MGSLWCEKLNSEQNWVRTFKTRLLLMFCKVQRLDVPDVIFMIEKIFKQWLGQAQHTRIFSWYLVIFYLIDFIRLKDLKNFQKSEFCMRGIFGP